MNTGVFITCCLWCKRKEET